MYIIYNKNKCYFNALSLYSGCSRIRGHGLHSIIIPKEATFSFGKIIQTF